MTATRDWKTTPLQDLSVMSHLWMVAVFPNFLKRNPSFSTVVTDWEKTLKAFRGPQPIRQSKWCHCCVVFFFFFTGREPWQFQSNRHPLQELPFLKLTASGNTWKWMIFPFGARPIFQVRTAVSFRECMEIWYAWWLRLMADPIPGCPGMNTFKI